VGSRLAAYTVRH